MPCHQGGYGLTQIIQLLPYLKKVIVTRFTSLSHWPINQGHFAGLAVIYGISNTIVLEIPWLTTKTDLKNTIFCYISWLTLITYLLKFYSDMYQRHQWFRFWSGAVIQHQAVTWDDDDQELWCNMESPGHYACFFLFCFLISLPPEWHWRKETGNVFFEEGWTFSLKAWWTYIQIHFLNTVNRYIYFNKNDICIHAR